MSERDVEGRPPRVASAVLRWVVSGDEADVVEGELAELFRRRVGLHGRREARWWYRRQVAGFALRVATTRERREEEGGMGWVSDVGGDVRWAVRMMRKRPTFTAVAILTLALGLGANTAIFTLVSAHFLVPLPFDRPEELALVWEVAPDRPDRPMTVSPANYFVWREEIASLGDVAAYNVDMATLSGESGDAAAERVTASVVTPHFFDVLGVRPRLGAGFSEEATRQASERLVVLSHSLWVRRYGGDPAIVGRDIRIDSEPHTVVGVMPASFRQPERALTWQGAELWRPMLLDDQRDDRGSHYLRTVARLAPGTTLDQAREETSAMAGRLAQAYPDTQAGWGVQVRAVDEYLLGEARPTLLLLLAAGVAVLLIVCANLANLLLARGEERRREFAVRAALGSGRGRMVRQIVVESVVLALGGAIFGALLVAAGREAIQAVQIRYFSGLVDVAVDARVLGLTTVLAVAAGVLFSLPVARSASRAELRPGLVEGGERAGGRPGGGPTRNLLVVGQVGLATSLVVIAALLTRSFNELVDVPPGFDPQGVVTFGVTPPSARYEERGSYVAYHQEIERLMREIPGVEEVGMVSDLPFTTENMWTTFQIEGRPASPPDEPRSDFHRVTPEYFAAMDIPVVRGAIPEQRWESQEDVEVAVNRRFADLYLPGRDPLGVGIVLEWSSVRTARIAAVVENVLDDGFAGDPEPILYLPYGASPGRRMYVVLRTAGDPGAVLTQVRTVVAAVDPDVPASDLRPLQGLLAETVARPRAASLIGSAFALLALLVAVAGIYGVLSYAVERRTREMGIRSALGASGRQLVSMVMGQTTRLLVVGLALGLAAAVVAGNALSGILFGVRGWDPSSLALATLLLGSVGTLAAWLPARRAVRIDPKEALRME
jgi:putative ABC transport system permease protein